MRLVWESRAQIYLFAETDEYGLSAATYVHSWIWLTTLKVDLLSCGGIFSLIFCVMTIPLCLFVLYDPVCNDDLANPLSESRDASDLVLHEWHTKCAISKMDSNSAHATKSTLHIPRVLHEYLNQIVWLNCCSPCFFGGATQLNTLQHLVVSMRTRGSQQIDGSFPVGSFESLMRSSRRMYKWWLSREIFDALCTCMLRAWNRSQIQ